LGGVGLLREVAGDLPKLSLAQLFDCEVDQRRVNAVDQRKSTVLRSSNW